MLGFCESVLQHPGLTSVFVAGKCINYAERTSCSICFSLLPCMDLVVQTLWLLMLRKRLYILQTVCFCLCVCTLHTLDDVTCCVYILS